MFKPLFDQILVKPLDRKQSDTLVVISNEKYNRGLIVACGPGERIKNKRGEETGAIREMQVHPGDWITYVDLDHIYKVYFENGIEYRILQDKDVTFVSERSFIDAHNSLSDAEIDNLISFHNSARELRAA